MKKCCIERHPETLKMIEWMKDLNDAVKVEAQRCSRSRVEQEYDQIWRGREKKGGNIRKLVFVYMVDDS